MFGKTGNGSSYARELLFYVVSVREYDFMYVGISILHLVKSKLSCLISGNTQNPYILSKYKS